MLTDQEKMNYALKEMLFHEENMAKKYAALATQITDPKLQQMLQGMEMGARNHHGTLAETIKSQDIE